MNEQVKLHRRTFLQRNRPGCSLGYDCSFTDPEPGDDAWGKLMWVIYPLIVVAVFTHGPLSEVLNKVLWSLLVIGLLVTSEWSRLKTPRTLLLLTFAAVTHLCIMHFSYGFLPEHKRTVAIVFVSVLEAIILGLPVKIPNLKQEK